MDLETVVAYTLAPFRVRPFISRLGWWGAGSPEGRRVILSEKLE